MSDLHSIPLAEHACPPEGFASHIHVLNREVPFILNITRLWLKLGWVLSYRDLTRQEAEDEATGMYLCRVPVRQYAPQRPHCLVEEAPDIHVGPKITRAAYPTAISTNRKVIPAFARMTSLRAD